MKATVFCLSLLLASAISMLFATPIQTTYIDGLKIILKPTTKEVVSVRLFYRGGTANYSANQDGLEALTLHLMIEGGTTNKDKVMFHTMAEKLGTEFNTSSSYDYSEINMTCVRMFWDESWELLADMIQNPAFVLEEFQLLKEKMITAARQTEANPDAHLRNLAMKHAFSGSHYGRIPDGTPESISRLSLEDVKEHYKKINVKNRFFLVVVGNVSMEDLTRKLKKSLSQLPAGDAPPVPSPTLITSAGLYSEDRDIATNYIRGMMSAPPMNHPNGVAMRLAMAILRDHFFIELRTKRSLTYAPQAAYATSIIHSPYNIIYASTQKPRETISVMIDIINKFKSEGFSARELQHQKEQTITQYYMGLQTAGDQSFQLGLAEMWGDVGLADSFHEQVKAVTLKDINRVFHHHTYPIKWTYLGRKEQIDETDFKQPHPGNGK